MSFLGDLLYFGPSLPPRRALALARAKLAKAARKRATEAALSREEPDAALRERLGLPGEAEACVNALRGLWAPLAPLSLPGGAEAASAEAADAARTRRAEEVLAGRQILFGRAIELGWPPRWDWRWNGHPQAETFAGDLRSSWEVQRLQGLLPLARAGAEERFALGYVEGVLDFQRCNPGPGGMAWASALELGLRLLALAQGLPRVAPSEAFAAGHVEILRVVDRHARRLRADLSLDKVVRGNHLLGELAGLLAAGLLLPGARASWWDGLAVRELLEAEILRQFHPDGVSVEQSLSYEKFVLEFLALAGSLGAARGEPFAAPARARLEAALEHLDCCAAPDGTLPVIGDCDSGRGADWGEEDPHRLGRFVADARRGLGMEAPAGGDPAPAPGVSWRHFPEGGHGVLKAGGDYLFLRGGPFGHGIPGPASHAHADLLAPVLYSGGEPVLLDPGVYGYGVGEESRDAMRAWEAHSAVSFEPPAGPVPAGTFRWRRIPPPAVLTGGLLPEGAAIEGELRPGGGGNPLLWHRSIRYNELHRAWLFLDRLSETASGPVTWAFRFAPGVRLEQTDRAGVYRVVLPSGRLLRLTLEPVGEVRLEEGWVAPSYGSRVTAPVLRRRLGRPPAEARTELAPLG